MKFKPYNYQKFAIDHIIDHPCCGLFLDMGLGKTVITLTAIEYLMYQDFEITKVLVIAPKRVALTVWADEAKKWNHLKHLNVSIVVGTQKQRKEALREEADVYVVNRENTAWLVGICGSKPMFDMLVIDELSSFKNHRSQRFKALRMVRPKVSRVVGLTGTPAPNTLIDLWAQIYLLDMGQRLGCFISHYREKYFIPGARNGAIVYNWNSKKTAKNDIFERIKDICVSMEAKDYLELPERLDRVVKVELDPKTKKKYDEFEKSMVLQFCDREEITALNAAGLSNKLLQFANGAVYDDDKNYEEAHDAKLEALEEIIDTATSPVLVFYNFKHDLERITKRLRKFKPRKLENVKDIRDWNAGKLQVLLAHPASAGHGLNLQTGGNVIVWFGLNWSLELYQQANARLFRQGQSHNVIIHHIIAAKTIDGDVMAALKDKAAGQSALIDAVKARIKKYRR